MKERKGYSRRKFISTVGATTAALPLMNSFASSAFNIEPADRLKIEKLPDTKQRNVIFILSDDHRFDFMGFMDKPGSMLASMVLLIMIHRNQRTMFISPNTCRSLVMKLHLLVNGTWEIFLMSREKVLING